MHIIKPLEPAFAYKNYDWEGKSFFSVSLMFAFPLEGGLPLLEQELWEFVLEELGKDAALDQGMPKLKSEFMVCGNCYTPGDKPQAAGKVRVKLGPLEKELYVFGNRNWKSFQGISEPEPFQSIPLTYEYAFGGTGFMKNPLGKGNAPIENEFGEKCHPLPNIENPKKLIVNKGDHPDPAGFAPIDLMWPQRQSKIGTYDEKWLQTNAPGFAADLDWSYFNETQPDQWYDGFLEGDESFEIEGMHPDKPQIKGTLPGYRARCFILQQKKDQVEHFREIRMRAETAWFFPHLDKGLLLYRGVIDDVTDDGEDILELLAGYEHLCDPPKSSNHYREALLKRTDPEQDYKYAMNSRDLIPIGAICGYQRILDMGDDDPENYLAQNMDAKGAQIEKDAAESIQKSKEEMAAEMKEQGLDPDEEMEKAEKAAKPDPKQAEIEALGAQIAPMDKDNPEKLDLEKVDLSKMDKISEKMEELGENSDNDVKESLKNNLEDLKKGSDDSDESKEMIAELEKAIANFDAPNPLPRPPGTEQVDSLRESIRKLEESKEDLRKAGVTEEEMPQIEIDLEEMEREVIETAVTFKETYRIVAHQMENGLLPHGFDVKDLSSELLSSFHNQEDLSGGDYAGVVFSEADLKGINLSQCYLEQSDFSGCDLSGGNFSQAILVRSTLRGASLKGANLREVNLGASDLREADFTGADLTNAILGKANLEGATFQDCQMENVDLLEALVAGADFSGAYLPTPIFLESDLTGACFAHSHIPDSTFLQCNLNQVDFSKSNVEKSSWIECDMAESNFSGAKMTKSDFQGECNLKDAVFRGAILDEANLIKTNLEGADFNGGSMKMATLAEANLTRASLSNLNAKGASFIKANLEEANVTESNFMETNLMKARLVKTNFTDSNLYCTEFLQATLSNTIFKDANLTGSKLENWHPPYKSEKR